MTSSHSRLRELTPVRSKSIGTGPPDAPRSFATVPAVTASADDPACTRGQLLASRLVLQEALNRLPADRIAELQSAVSSELRHWLRTVQKSAVAHPRTPTAAC